MPLTKGVQMKNRNRKCGPLLTKLKKMADADPRLIQRLAIFGGFTGPATIEMWIKRASIPSYHIEKVISFLQLEESNGNPY